MPKTSGFLKLESRYAITARLVPSSALHIGSGAISAKTDAPFFCDDTGPLIPGSGLRGALRSRLEKILQAIGGDRGCVLFTTDADCTHTKCFTVNSDLLKSFQKQHAMKPTLERERLLEEKLLEGDGLCDICRLFGSPLMASKLRISDARPKDSKVQVRDGVGIDRDTETAREHIKYDFEALYSSGFELRVEIENATDWDLALLAILFREMRDPGIELGGKKSRGLGRCKLEGELKVQGFSGSKELGRFLGTGKLEDVPGFQSRLSKCLERYLGVSTDAKTGTK